jgi:splicing factor 3B subunit 1
MSDEAMAPPAEKRNRFESRFGDADAGPPAAPEAGRLWDSIAAAQTPRQADGLTPSATPRPSRFDRGATPTPFAGGSRFDQTPSFASGKWDATPSGATPLAQGTPVNQTTWGATPGMADGSTPLPKWDNEGGAFAPGFQEEEDDLDGLDARQKRLVSEMKHRNRYLTDEELDAALPPGYDVVAVPAELAAEYEKRRRDAEEEREAAAKSRLHDIPESVGDNLPPLRAEDAATFELLLQYRHVPNDADLPAEDARSVMVLRCLLRIKNGDAKQRKQGFRIIAEKARYFGPEILFQHIFDLWMSETLDNAEKHAVVKLIDRVLFHLGDVVTPTVPQILTVIQPLLSEPDPYTRDEGREVIANLARAVGLKPIVLALKRDMDDASDEIRQLTSRTMAIVAKTLGVEPMAEFLAAVCNSRKSAIARQTGLKIVGDIAGAMGSAVRKDVRLLISAVTPCLQDQQIRVKIQAAHTVAALAEACHPHGIDEFVPVLGPIRKECRNNRGKVLGACLRAMGSLIALMSAADAMDYAQHTLDTITRAFATVDEDLRRVVIRVVQQLARHSGITREFLLGSISGPFFAAFWTVRLAIDRRTIRSLLETTVELAKRVGAATPLQVLTDFLRDRDMDVGQRPALQAVNRIVDRVGTVELTADLSARLFECALDTLQGDESGSAYAAVTCIISICKSLERRMAPFVMQLIAFVKARLTHSTPNVRRQAAELIGRVAEPVIACQRADQLADVSRLLVERLSGEVDAAVLASGIRALRLILESLPHPSMMQPGLPEVLQQLVPIIKNPSDDVQQRVIELIGRIAVAVHSQLDNADHEDLGLLRVKLSQLSSDGLFYLLKSKRKRTRVATAETFGEIATAVTPVPIVKHLLNNLKKDDRTERICTEVALAVVAKRCKPWAVIPFLVNEFRLAQSTELAEKTQHAVLKTLRFLFEYLNEDGAPYIWSVVPLLEWSLTEKSLQYRRMACEVVRHMALSAVASDFEEVLVHMLNLIHPNLIETTTGSEQFRLTTAVTEVFEAARLTVNPAYLMRMLEQGMWHPARKVRDAYWRVYNSLYLGCGEALVPTYAPTPNEGEATYVRSHLQCLV